MAVAFTSETAYFDFDVYKAIELDVANYILQRYGSDSTLYDREKAVQKFTVTFDGVDTEIVVFAKRYIHIYGLLKVIVGPEVAKAFYNHVRPNHEEHCFALFNISLFSFDLKEMLCFFTESDRQKIEVFIQERYDLQIDKQCGFVFSKAMISSEISNIFQYSPDMFESMKGELGYFKGLSKDEIIGLYVHMMETMIEQSNYFIQGCNEEIAEINKRPS